ncbi:MAG: LamG domain-containing protein [Candidatus Micrarchaeota archaeon]
MQVAGPFFIIAFAALLNVTHVEGLEDDFSNILIEITDSSGTYFANHSVVEYEPGAWASVNVTVPDEEYSLGVLSSNDTGAEVQETYPGMIEVAYAEGMAEDFSNLLVAFVFQSGYETPVAYSIVAFEPGEWAILSLERPPAEGESISILISQPVEPVPSDAEPEARVDGAAPGITETGDAGDFGGGNGLAEDESAPDEGAGVSGDATANGTISPAGEAPGPSEWPPAPVPVSESGAYALEAGEYVELPGFDIYPGEGDFTASAWIRTESSSDAVILSSGECCEIEKYWSMALSAGGDGAYLLIRLNDAMGEISSIGTTDLADGEWHHVAFVRDRSAGIVTGYVDGFPDLAFNDTSGAISDSSQQLLIGNSNPHQDEWFEGSVSGAATTLGALSAEELALLASFPAPLEEDSG